MSSRTSSRTARLAHDDLPTVAEMGADGDRTRAHLGVPDPRDAGLGAGLGASRSRTEVTAREVTVSETARRLATAVWGD